MHYRRAELRRNNILSAEELRTRKDGEFVRTAGCIIARQRPGTAKGFIFISMEDETGIANVFVTPDLYERDRLVVTRSKFLLVEGPLQNQDNAIHVKATRLTTLSDRALRSTRVLDRVPIPLGQLDVSSEVLQIAVERSGTLCASTPLLRRYCKVICTVVAWVIEPEVA